MYKYKSVIFVSNNFDQLHDNRLYNGIRNNVPELLGPIKTQKTALHYSCRVMNSSATN